MASVPPRRPLSCRAVKSRVLGPEHSSTLFSMHNCGVKATQAGNATYAAATLVIEGFQVKP